MQFQVCPRAKEGGQVDEGVETQSIVAIVGQVGHEYTDLLWRNREGEMQREFMNICSTYWVILIKSKSHFPSSHVYTKNGGRAVNIITVVVTAVESKQIILSSCDGFKFTAAVGGTPIFSHFFAKLTCVAHYLSAQDILKCREEKKK